MIASCSFFSLCLSILSSVVALRTLVVLGAQSMQTSKLSRKTNKTFDDARWMLTIIRVTTECQDTTGLARLCRGTWLMRILTKMGKWYMKRVLVVEVP
jgi:hypothetical protein